MLVRLPGKRCLPVMVQRQAKKRQAAELLQKNQLAEACSAYGELCRHNPDDVASGSNYEKRLAPIRPVLQAFIEALGYN